MAVRNEPPVIIMPKSTQNSNETRKAIRNCIDPLSLSLKVQSVSNRKDGAIAINCEDDESREKIENEVKNKLANDYVVKIPKIKDPCVIVCGISSEWEKDKVVKAIKNQNDITDPMECVHFFKVKSQSFNPYRAVIKTNADNYQHIIERQKLNIGWDACKVFPYVFVKRCYNCWGYNHVASECKNKRVCPRCSEDHVNKECGNAAKCNNCVQTNAKLKLDLNTNHDCRSRDCPLYIKKIQTEKNRIKI